MLCVGKDFVGGVSLDVDNETDAARVLLVLGVVKTLSHGQHSGPGGVLFIDCKIVVGLLMELFVEGCIFDVRGHSVQEARLGENNKLFFYVWCVVVMK